MKAKGIVAINEVTGEKRVFSSKNEAARELRVTFQAIDIAAMRCGTASGWRIYDAPEALRERIEELQRRLKIVESY